MTGPWLRRDERKTSTTAAISDSRISGFARGIIMVFNRSEVAQVISSEGILIRKLSKGFERSFLRNVRHNKGSLSRARKHENCRKARHERRFLSHPGRGHNRERCYHAHGLFGVCRHLLQAV